MNKTLTPINSLKVTLGAAVVTIGALAFAYNPDISGAAPAENKTAPAYTAVAALALTSANTGTAVIRLDGFTLDVSFDFEKVDDSYGVPGSEFTTAEITSLNVDKVLDDSGYPVRDFTDVTDHRSINAMLVAHMLKNRMLEAV